MKYPIKFVIIAISVFFFFYSLELLNGPIESMDVDDYAIYVLLIIGVISSFIFLACELLKVSKKIMDICYELVAVFSAIGWINILATLIIDFISFLAFYFNIQKLILASLLLSAGNTIGDFFGNAALAKAGEPIMGAMASYSGQIFNNFIGFSASVLASSNAGYSDFNVFYLGNNNITNSESMKCYFMICLMITVVIIISYSITFLFINKFVFKKSFHIGLVFIYIVFFIVAITFGILSRD